MKTSLDRRGFLQISTIPALALGSLDAFRPQEKPTISVRVDEVLVLAVVRDEKGRIRNDLRKEDFILEDEEKRVEIKHFARETDLPLTIGLLVDTSMSQLQVLKEQKWAMLQFLQQVLRPSKDLAFLISFDVDSELLEDMTNNLRALERALQQARHPGTQGRPQFGTVLFDALFLAADEVLKGQTGRKTVILTSDGVDYGSVTDMASALENAQRADTVIYSLCYSSQFRNPLVGTWRGSGRRPRAARALPDGRKTLKRLSDETGGRMFELSEKLTAAEVFRQIQEELRSQYILGYTPPEDFAAKTFRKIGLRTGDRKLRVFCRSGYYPRATRSDSR